MEEDMKDFHFDEYREIVFFSTDSETGREVHYVFKYSDESENKTCDKATQTEEQEDDNIALKLDKEFQHSSVEISKDLDDYFFALRTNSRRRKYEDEVAHMRFAAAVHKQIHTQVEKELRRLGVFKPTKPEDDSPDMKEIPEAPLKDEHKTEPDCEV